MGMLDLLTLLDIAKLNGRDRDVGLIEENLTFAPEVGLFPSRVIKGKSYKVTKRVLLPEGGGFRAPGAGITPDKSTFANELVECFLYSRLLKADPAVLNTAEDDSMEDLKALEMSGSMQAAFIYLARQIYYGTGLDKMGFPGLLSFSNPELELNAGGTTADKASTVFAVKFGPQNVHMIYGNSDTFAFGEWVKQLFAAADGKEYMGEASQLDSWMGLANGSKYSVGRIKNLTEQSGKTLTDDMVADLLSQYPVGYTPDRLFMTRRSARQLQKSRSATVIQNGQKSTGGTEVTAPLPDSSNGIPITITDSIKDDDKIEAAA